jgi:hypothetical protein
MGGSKASVRPAARPAVSKGTLNAPSTDPQVFSNRVMSARTSAGWFVLNHYHVNHLN